MKINFCVLLALLLLACHHPAVTVVNSEQFPQVKLRQLTQHLSLDKTAPRSLTFINGKLVILEKYDYPFFKVYDTARYLKIAQFGSKKSASCPLYNPFMAGRGLSRQTRDILYVNDMSNNKFVTFDLKQIAPGKPIIPLSQFYLPTSFVLKYNVAHKIDDHSYWLTYSGNDRRGRFAIYNSFSKATQWIPYFPKADFKISDRDLPFYYYSYTAVNDSLHVVGAAMKFFKRVDFFDREGKLINSTVFKPFDHSLPPYKPAFSEDFNTKIYFNESFAGQRYYYTTCVNTSELNYIKNVGNMELHIFDWGGNLKKIVKLDKMFLGFFAVDETQMKLYIISYLDSDKNQNIIVYDLKNLNL